MGRKPVRPDIPVPAPGGAFATLAALRGSLPPGSEPEPEPGTTRSPFAGRILVTRERKGRGGRTVTLVRGIELDGSALGELAREIRQTLGTGGGLEGDTIVLHGDLSARVSEWLRAHGATRLVNGS